jgi:hypothetical protein
MRIVGNTDTVAPTGSGDLDLDTDYVKVDTGIWVTGETSGVTFNASGYLEVVTAGLYEVSAWACFSVSAAGTNLVAFKYSVDDTTSNLSPRRLTRQSNNANDIGSVAASGFVSLPVGAKISLWVASDATSTTATILDAGITATLLKAT